MAKAKAPARAPAPKAVGDTVAITAVTAASPTVATASETDVAKVHEGDTVTLASELAELDGQTAIVTLIDATSFSMPIDLSAVDVTDATATATVTAEAPAPAPSPTPPPLPAPEDFNHQMSSMSPGVTTMFHPSPGVGGGPTDDWVPPEGWTPPDGWEPAPPPRGILQPGDHFETPREDRPDTVPGGTEIADKLHQDDDKLRDAPRQPDPELERGLSSDFDKIAADEGIR